MRRIFSVRNFAVFALLALLAVGGLMSRQLVSMVFAASPRCGITPELVQNTCGIPSAVKLQKPPFSSCGVGVSGGLSSRYINTLSQYQVDLLDQELVQGNTVAEIKQASLSSALNSVGIFSAYDRKRARFVPQLTEVSGVGDAAWYIPRPLFKSDTNAGLQDPGFSFYVARQGKVARLDSGGADYAIKKAGEQRYSSVGGGCSLEEVKQIAQQVSVSYLEEIAQRDLKYKERHAADVAYMVGLTQKRRELAKKLCPTVDTITSLCKGASSALDVQAFDLHDWGGSGSMCFYLKGLTEEVTSRSSADFPDPTLIQRDLDYYTALKVVVNKEKTPADVHLLYEFTVKSFLTDKNVVGRNELGLESLRTHASLGFKTSDRVVTVTQGRPNRTCTSEELHKVGALF